MVDQMSKPKCRIPNQCQNPNHKYSLSLKHLKFICNLSFDIWHCCRILLLASCFLLFTAVFAQVGGIPGTLLNYGMSPRTIGMGKTFTGLADDQEAIYYNPAGLTQLTSHNIKASFLSLYGAQISYLGYGLPTRKIGTLGLSMISFSARDVTARDDQLTVFPDFGFSQNCFIFTYAVQPLRTISLGANFKLVTSKIAQYGALGMGGDLGLFFSLNKNLTFGIAGQNILGPKLAHYQETEIFPLTFRAGGAIKLYQDNVIIVFDLVKNTLDYTSLEPHFGIEFTPITPNLILRGGYDKNFLNLGIGIKNDWSTLSFGLDYSIELHYASSYLLPPRHKIGMFISFGGFRTWVGALPKKFSPTPNQKENVAWLDIHYTTKRKIERWQLLVKNRYGEIIRTYSGWDAPPRRLTWDGLDDIGRIVRDGKYYYEIILIDELGETLSFHDLLTEVVTLGPEGGIEFLPQE